MKKELERVWIETRKTLLLERKMLPLAFSWLGHRIDNML